MTRNKNLYKNLTFQDTFSDRIIIFLIHFAFFLKNHKTINNKKFLQKLYDFIFRQLEHSIREIGYGDQSVNKRMKDFINVFHGILLEIHFWEKMTLIKQAECLSKFLPNFNNIDFLVRYFEDFSLNLKKYDLNSYLKSVCKD